MNKKRIVITGIGVISSVGIGKDAFFEAVSSGASGIKPISLFDTSLFKMKVGGEVADFHPEQFLGNKGLRTLDRTVKLTCSAAKLSIDDSGLIISEDNSRDFGVCVGTALGSIKSISDYDREAQIEGPRYVNPALFPNTVINSAAGQLAIRFGIKGFNTTISSGFTSGIEAINYAVDAIRLGRAKVVLVGAAEELCLQEYLGFYRTDCLAKEYDDSGNPIFCPFDQRRNGIVLGEGAAIFVLEELNHALDRKARIYAEVKGCGSGFDACGIKEYNPNADGLKSSMRAAIDESGLKEENIDCIYASANSTSSGDLMEACAVEETFRQHSEKVYVSAIKSMLGECFSASGVLNLAAAVGALEKQIASAVLNYEDKDSRFNINISNKPRKGLFKNILVNSFGPGGNNASVVVSKFN